MSAYALLLACYRSGQISEAAWCEHLRDEVFAAWVRRKINALSGPQGITA